MPTGKLRPSVRLARQLRKKQLERDCKRYKGICKCILPEQQVFVVKACPAKFYPPCGAVELMRRVNKERARATLAAYVPPPVEKPCIPAFSWKSFARNQIKRMAEQIQVLPAALSRWSNL